MDTWMNHSGSMSSYMNACPSECDVGVFSIVHYSDITMGAVASEITNLTIVNSTGYSVADHRNYQSSASPVTGEFLTQRASNVENVSIWWRHRDIYVIEYQKRYYLSCITTQFLCFAHLKGQGPILLTRTNLNINMDK